jgi:hypothetical protein
VGLAYRGPRPAQIATAQPMAFRPEVVSRGALSPIGTGSLPTKSSRPVADGRVGHGRGASPGDGDSAGV